MCKAPGLILACIATLAGCAKSDDRNTAVVYCSVDADFARQVLAAFEERTGIDVQPVFDSEAGKTTGLAQRIRLEAGRPRADVFFSGELFQTMLLAREGMFAPYEPATAQDIPARYKDAEKHWTGIGLRGRVLCYDSERQPADTLPSTWRALSDEANASRLAFANPLFGTTYGHVTAMFALWGEADARAFLTEMRERGAKMVDGNSSAVRAVIAGEATMCMTDTDDVRVAKRQAPSLAQRYLDMGDGGTLLIPSSVALIRDCPHPEPAKRLVDFLVSADVERMLAESESGNIPVRESLREELHIDMPPASSVAYDAIADAMKPAGDAVREILIR